MKSFKVILRGFRKNGRLNLLNIVSMAIGIVTAVIVLAYVYQEFNYDCRNKNSDNIFRVLTLSDNNELSGAATYGPLAQSLKADFPEIYDATRASFYYGYLALSAGEKKFNETNTIFADPNFFSFFSFPLISGDAANCFNSPNSVMLSENTAKKYFGEEGALGKQIKIGSKRVFTVQGIYKDFGQNSNFNADIILPLEIISKLTQVWIEPSWNYPADIHTFILTENKADVDVVSSKITGYLSGHVKENPEKLFLQPLKNIHTEMQTGWESVPQINVSYLYLLVIVALIVLAMSAVNFFMLYIGMASKRELNTGVRKVCGASRAALFRGFLNETLSYLFFSLILSLLLIVLCNFFLAGRVEFLPEIKDMNRTLLLILLGVLFVYTFSTSILSSLFASRQKTDKLFKSEIQSLQRQPRILNTLVIGQFAVSIALFAITTLFYKQVHFLEKHNPGFAREELVTIPLNMHIGEGFYNENMGVFCEELKKQSGVKNVTFAFSSPADVQTSTDNFRCDGMPEGKTVNMQWNTVFYDYFETLGVQMLEGRSFSSDFQNDMFNDDNGKCSYIINSKAARELGVENPIGKTLYAYGEGPIVGIVEDFNFKSLHSSITPMCFSMNPIYFNEIIVRINPQAEGVLAGIEKVWKDFVPEYPFEFKFVDDHLTRMYQSESNLTATLNVFAGIAILIACMGLLALTILSMQKRTKEIGIRKVNGAKVSEILTLLNRDFVKRVAIAFVIACPLAYLAMNKWLENFAYKTGLSWWIFVLAGVLALVIALLTVSWQSWRAATRNPVEALRYE